VHPYFRLNFVLIQGYPDQNMYIQGPSSSPVSVVKGSKDYMNEHKPGAALQPVVTPAPKTVGAYLQTSTRHLIPDSKSII